MRTEDLDFDLPPELIAQMPTTDRAASRLLHYRISDGTISHRTFSDLPSLLSPADLLVFNDAKVIPARFTLQKDTGGKIEGLFLSEPSRARWRVLLKNLGNYRGELHFTGAIEIGVTPITRIAGGGYEIEVQTNEPAVVLLSRVGRMPLPPYIKRDREADERDEFDRERYQTVFARASGSVAAPTAGLHFTPEIFAELQRRGIEKAFVTLHVGMGTFQPIKSDNLESHAMHVESYSVDAATAATLNRAKQKNHRIVAVGTTAARTLESQPQTFEPITGETGIFIYPPYRWNHVGPLITNFHLPRSTLIALVAAKVGLEEQRRIYREAIAQRYRFFSYGDAMLIE